MRRFHLPAHYARVQIVSIKSSLGLTRMCALFSRDGKPLKAEADYKKPVIQIEPVFFYSLTQSRRWRFFENTSPVKLRFTLIFDTEWDLLNSFQSTPKWTWKSTIYVSCNGKRNSNTGGKGRSIDIVFERPISQIKITSQRGWQGVVDAFSGGWGLKCCHSMGTAHAFYSLPRPVYPTVDCRNMSL